MDKVNRFAAAVKNSSGAVVTIPAMIKVTFKLVVFIAILLVLLSTINKFYFYEMIKFVDFLKKYKIAQIPVIVSNFTICLKIFNIIHNICYRVNKT